MQATARAHINIALIKYWGKLPGEEKLPAMGSLSLTLEKFYTETSVEFDPRADVDSLVIEGLSSSEDALRRAKKILRVVRERSGISHAARMTSRNTVPAGEGLASSASAFAALAVAASHAAGLALSPTELSSLARLGSGSAARSIFGAFSEIAGPGEPSAAQLVPPSDFVQDIRMVVAQVPTGPKEVSSSAGMLRTMETSPYYPAWVSSHPSDLAEARAALLAGDFTKLGEVSEHNALKMHASSLAARPPILYFRGASLEAFHSFQQLRKQGIEVYGTADAGAHPIGLCRAVDSQAVAAALQAITGISHVTIAAAGPAAYVVASGESPRGEESSGT